MSSFRQSRNKLNPFNLFRLCRKDEISFEIVAENGNIVAKNGNNVEATFDIVERIVQFVAFDNVAGTLLLVWTGLNANKLIGVSAATSAPPVPTTVTATAAAAATKDAFTHHVTCDVVKRFHAKWMWTMYKSMLTLHILTGKWESWIPISDENNDLVWTVLLLKSSLKCKHTPMCCFAISSTWRNFKTNIDDKIGSVIPRHVIGQFWNKVWPNDQQWPMETGLRRDGKAYNVFSVRT